MREVPVVADGLWVSHVLPACGTLGPGRRGIVWVSGCERRCPGCIADPILERATGTRMAIGDLTEQILGWSDIEGLTFSGGEPFEQAEALANLCRQVRSRRDLSVVCYSGYSLAELHDEPLPGCRELLGQVDILIDGPFDVADQGDLLWRGSRNQRLHFLTDRYRDWEADVDSPGAGVELHVRPDGGIFWAGVPERGFESRLTAMLAQNHGIRLESQTGAWQ